MIEKLTAITGHTEQDDLDRGEIIRAAFKEKTLAAPTAPVAASAPAAARE